MNIEPEAKAEELQSAIESKVGSIGKGKYGRILKMANTPNREQFKKTAYIAALGLVILGVVGFVITWVMTRLPGYF